MFDYSASLTLMLSEIIRLYLYFLKCTDIVLFSINISGPPNKRDELVKINKNGMELSDAIKQNNGAIIYGWL